MDGLATGTNTSAPRHHPGPAASSLLAGEDGAGQASPHLSPSGAPVPIPILAERWPDEIAEQTFVAPSPDTVLAVRHFGLDAQDQGQANEALLREKHAAEVARLTQALHTAKQAHLVEIERLRARHAADVQRLVEALWHAQDAARAASARPETAAGPPAPEPQPSVQLEPMKSCALRGRFLGWSALSPLARTCTLLRRNLGR